MREEWHAIKFIRERAQENKYPEIENVLNDLLDMLDAYDKEREYLATITQLFQDVVNGGFHYHHVKPLADALGVPLLNRQQVAEHVADKRDAQTVALLAEMAHAGE